MPRATCPGLPADWLNGWLAAVGTTVLDSRLRLQWTADGNPLAVLSAETVDPLAVVVESWPDAGLLKELPIAENWKDTVRLERKVPVDAFAARVRSARGHRHSWTLSSTMTDLCVDENGEVAHAPFDPAGPGTIKWLHHRLMKVHSKVEPTAERIRDSLEGRAVRIEDNGLGFDQTRLGSQADDAPNWVDPVVETLAFFGLAVLPVRGNGVDRRLNHRASARERQKGWLNNPRDQPGRRFVWPAWSQPLDTAGIDALMDVWKPERRSSWARLGVQAGWQSVQFIPRGQDKTRAFGSKPL